MNGKFWMLMELFKEIFAFRGADRSCTPQYCVALYLPLHGPAISQLPYIWCYNYLKVWGDTQREFTRDFRCGSWGPGHADTPSLRNLTPEGPVKTTRIRGPKSHALAKLTLSVYNSLQAPPQHLLFIYFCFILRISGLGFWGQEFRLNHVTDCV